MEVGWLMTGCADGWIGPRLDGGRRHKQAIKEMDGEVGRQA